MNAPYSKEVEKEMILFFNTLPEKQKRLYVASESTKLGHGGGKYIASLFGCSTNTICLGKKDLKDEALLQSKRIRREGGGKMKMLDKRPELNDIFLEILKDNTAGSPTDEEIKCTDLTVVGIKEIFFEKGIKLDRTIVK